MCKGAHEAQIFTKQETEGGCGPNLEHVLGSSLEHLSLAHRQAWQPQLPRPHSLSTLSQTHCLGRITKPHSLAQRKSGPPPTQWQEAFLFTSWTRGTTGLESTRSQSPLDITAWKAGACYLILQRRREKGCFLQNLRF